jgi:hypothetical protein
MRIASKKDRVLDERGLGASALWWVGIIAITVSFTNLTVSAVDQQFRLLILRDRTSMSRCFSLGRVNRSGAAVPGTLHCPTISMRHNVLVLS